MPSELSAFEYDNVNGIKLILHVKTRNGLPTSKQFTISYKNIENNATWPKKSLFFAILFNIIALLYVRISVTAILIIVVVLSFLVFFWITHSVQSESLLVIPTVGIQSSVKYVCGREDNFVSWASVDDVIINEVIKTNRVLYYLTLLVKINGQCSSEQDTKLIPLFKYTKPRLVMLEQIYSELQTLLIQSQKVSTLGSGDIG
ncbi:hypothetical protein K1T71_010839 [Dendrolimus kikuchii]|uniref:Uncharacterized protein n=1 Tax=Dendrolimus kikuchii TaxID=765133 RepID=A0ACC1CPZ8_9NEOP|nr:hypothetical protein K1T71_010839 [Dendrolimus kikuchii]